MISIRLHENVLKQRGKDDGISDGAKIQSGIISGFPLECKRYPSGTISRLQLQIPVLSTGGAAISPEAAYGRDRDRHVNHDS